MTNLIQIEGIVLTPDAIKLIKQLQEEDNSLLNHMQTILADAICFITDCNPNDEQKPEQFETMKQLNFIRRYIKDLAKP